MAQGTIYRLYGDDVVAGYCSIVGLRRACDTTHRMPSRVHVLQQAVARVNEWHKY